MVRRRLRSFVNNLGPSRMGSPMLPRVAVVLACVLGAASAASAVAEELAPEQARAFVVGKLFAYTCFDGTAGMGRIFSDGSVVGTIRPSGRGEMRFAALPPGTIKVSSASVCAHLNGLTDRTVLPGGEDRLPQLPRFARRSGLCLLRFLPAQSAHADDRPHRRLAAGDDAGDDEAGGRVKSIF